MLSKVTAVEVQKRNKKRVNIYIENEYAFSCDMELVYKHTIKVGSSFDAEEIEKIVENDNYVKAKRDALSFLERSYKTESEVCSKLQKKGYDEKTINRVIDFMREYKFVDDEKYINLYINDKLNSQGRKKIVFDLRKKGVGEDALSGNIDKIHRCTEVETAYKLAEKKYAVLSKRYTEKQKLNNKLSQYLFSRGYSWDIIKEVLRGLLKTEIHED
jgi:regulatory protein